MMNMKDKTKRSSHRRALRHLCGADFCDLLPLSDRNADRRRNHSGNLG